MAEEQSPEEWFLDVEQEVDGMLAEPPGDFGTLLQVLPSIDPLVVADILRRRAERGNAQAATLLSAASVAYADSPLSPRPIAHPLEYDWRFTARTTLQLVDRLKRATRDGDTIGYLGAPAAFALAIDQVTGRQHVLLDSSTRWQIAMSDAARIISIDLLRDPLPALELDAALLDPPWYPEYHDAFLWATGSLLRPTGLVLASFPPLTMRPRVAVEREEILRNAARAGLVVKSVESLALRYATPPFERAAFAAAGVLAVPNDWRRGDLLSFRKDQVSSAARPRALSDASEWEFVEIDEIPLALRKLDGRPGTVPPAILGPAVRGATLPSVSRRNPARRNAVLWSSCNRIYTSSAPLVLRAVVRSLVGAGDVFGAVEAVLERRLAPLEQDNVVAAANQVHELIRTERKEHGLDRSPQRTAPALRPSTTP